MELLGTGKEPRPCDQSAQLAPPQLWLHLGTELLLPIPTEGADREEQSMITTAWARRSAVLNKSNEVHVGGNGASRGLTACIRHPWMSLLRYKLVCQGAVVPDLTLMGCFAQGSGHCSLQQEKPIPPRMRQWRGRTTTQDDDPPTTNQGRASAVAAGPRRRSASSWPYLDGLR
jgi:hypothetical protein